MATKIKVGEIVKMRDENYAVYKAPYNYYVTKLYEDAVKLSKELLGAQDRVLSGAEIRPDIKWVNKRF